jgi:hypothetical protein
MPIQEVHRLGREHLNAGRYFPAHEAWETAWKKARNTDDRRVLQGTVAARGPATSTSCGGQRARDDAVAQASIGTPAAYPDGHGAWQTTRVAKQAEAPGEGRRARRGPPARHAEFETPRV